ncbi:MAG: protein-(glutamine-N5) methyltransferase, release factor-specific, partial [Marinospirillum sp.]|nr:protein-(glutamine-N5) methyltransferase, release factor-specific [Marinospirillum sp.]
PYIRPQDPHLTQGDLRYEPDSALVGGDDGLQAYRQLLAGIPRHLKPDGWLLVEHGYDQEAELQTLFHQAGLAEITTHRDYAGQPRVTQGSWKKTYF